MALQPFVRPWPLYKFLDLLHSRHDSMDGDQPVARPLPAHRIAQTQTAMPQVGFETMIPVFEGAKIVHDLDRAVTVIGKAHIRKNKNRNTDSISVISSFRTFPYITKVSTLPHHCYIRTT
jgi:hypothetical protein